MEPEKQAKPMILLNQGKPMSNSEGKIPGKEVLKKSVVPPSETS
jgi:hypothetical protein